MSTFSKNSRSALALGCLAAAAIILLSVNFISASAFRHVKADLTEADLYTISSGTREILGRLDEPVDLRLYYSRQLGEIAPAYARYFERVRGLLEQYRDISGGKVQVSYLDPEPFSDTEDRAVAADLKGIRLNMEGDMGYFGLVGTNSTDNQNVIQFFAPDRERFLEYDLTKLIHGLSDPKKPKVGVMAGIDIAGSVTPQGQQTPAWTVMEQIKEFFDLYPLDQDLEEIPGLVDTLLVVHPDELTEQAAYAIDQFALRGGKVLAFVDPVSEMGQPARSPMGGPPPEPSGAIVKVLEGWGVEYDPGKVAADVAHARRVQFGAGRGGTQPMITDHVAWLSLDGSSLDKDDVLSSGIEQLNIATAGLLKKKEGAETKFQPIIRTGTQSMAVDASEFKMRPDPARLLRNFRPGGEQLTLAARVTGKAKTAFPDGRPEEEKSADGEKDKKDSATSSARSGNEKDDTDKPHVTEGEINAIVVADSDMLHDRFWVESGNFLGQQISIPNAHNAAFVVNALDNLSGSSELISLRGRGVDNRPFELVEDLRKASERRYRRKEEALVSRLENVRRKLATIEQKEEAGDVILSEEDKKSIENFRRDMVAIRRDLRQVKRALREDIDLLEGTLKFANIAGVPFLIALGGIAVAVARRRRRSRREE